MLLTLLSSFVLVALDKVNYIGSVIFRIVKRDMVSRGAGVSIISAHFRTIKFKQLWVTRVLDPKRVEFSGSFALSQNVSS